MLRPPSRKVAGSHGFEPGADAAKAADEGGVEGRGRALGGGRSRSKT